MRQRVVASVGIILGTLFLASLAFADYPDEGFGRGSTETWVMNLHDTLDANVVASFFDRDGFHTKSIEGTIAPLGNASFPASSSGLAYGWLGSMRLDSLRPIVSVAETLWKNVPQGDGWSATTVNDTGEGAQEIFFPSICKTTYHRSMMTIQCVDSTDCDVYMTYRDRGGNLVTGSPVQETIEAFSQETYDLWDPSVNPNIPEQQFTPSAWWGSLQVTSTEMIAGVARTHSRPGYASAYNAVPRSEESEVFFPSVVRTPTTRLSPSTSTSTTVTGTASSVSPMRSPPTVPTATTPGM
jgi:hypothetical protein